ncbi:MAG: hypothetical protein JKX72_11950 [Robiginitomaculum sp.]|nr:hypothetical protein [Robiginitomaculum sp.]
MTKDLFRKEAIRHRTRALFGDVILAAPLSTWVITILLMVIVVGLIGFSLFASIMIDGESVPIWLWALGKTA